MFSRHIQAGEHRQHIRPPGSAAAPFGVQRVADFAGELPPVEETQPLDEVDMGLEGPVDDYSYSMASRTAVSLDAFEQEGYDAWHRDEPAAPAANKMVMDALEGASVGDRSNIEIMKAFSRGFERGRQEMMDREFPEMRGASRTAAGWVLDELADVFGLNTPLGNGWSVLQPNGGDPVLFREFNDYDSGKVSAPDSSGVWNWSVHARLYQVHVGSGAANTAEEAMSMVEQTYAEYKRTAARVANVCQKCEGMGRETYETDTGSLSTQTCTACGGTGQAKTASRRTAFLDTMELPKPRHRVAGWDWDDHLNGFIAAEAAREFTCSCGDNVPAPGYTDCRCGKRWNAYAISANGSKKMIAREVPVRDGVVMARRTAFRKTAADYSNYSYDQLVDARDILRQEFADWKIDQSEYKDTLAEIEAEAESRGLTLASRKGRVMARTASRRTAETIDSENLQVGDVVKYGDETITIIGEQEYWEDPFGRDMMKYMARSSDGREGYVMFGYGASLPVVASTRTASRKTAAGWNKGTHPDISDLSDEQLQDFIDNVQESIDAGANVGEIMKNKRDRFEEELRSRGRKATRKQAADYSNHSYDQLVDERDILRQQYADWEIDQSEYRDTLAEIEAEAESRGLTLASRKGRKMGSRKIAAPSSGADAIAQYFPGWRVDDENGNFWEIHSPGGEHAFIHEENGTYTLLMDDNTPDEFYETGLSFEDALAEVRAEGII